MALGRLLFDLREAVDNWRLFFEVDLVVPPLVRRSIPLMFKNYIGI